MVQASDAIAPGSTPYGERDTLGDAANSAQQGGGTPSGPAATSGSAGVGGPLDPLQAMLTGKVRAGSEPITAGLSRGPGDSPATPVTTEPVKERLKYLAVNAKSPHLRLQARAALRAYTNQRRLEAR